MWQNTNFHDKSPLEHTSGIFLFFEKEERKRNMNAAAAAAQLLMVSIAIPHVQRIICRRIYGHVTLMITLRNTSRYQSGIETGAFDYPGLFQMLSSALDHVARTRQKTEVDVWSFASGERERSQSVPTVHERSRGNSLASFARPLFFPSRKIKRYDADE